MRILLAICFLAVAAGTTRAQADRETARRLLEAGEEALNAGDKERAGRCFARAWAVMAEVYWLEGNRTSASEAWRNAEKYGWKGKPPWVKWPAPDMKPAPVRPAPTRPIARQNGNGFRLRQEEPLYPRGFGARRKQVETFWPYFARSPYRTGRNNPWHSLVNIPDMEEARGLVAEYWHVRLGAEISSSDFSDDSDGGTSRWNTTLAQQTTEVNYAVFDGLLVGGRVTFGELFERSDNLITVWDDGMQIIPDGKRSFAVESLVARGKYVGDLGFANWGVLLELKIPTTDEETLLTSDSWDLGVSGILSKNWESLSVTLNMGIVLPIGDAGVFTDYGDDDLDPVFHGGVAISYEVFDSVVLTLQLEGNTSPFGGVAILDEPAFNALLGGRYRLTESAFIVGTIGTGFGDLSNDLILSGAIDFTF